MGVEIKVFRVMMMVAFLALMTTTSMAAQPDDELPMGPVLRPDGGKWRIGYLEGGHYNDYPPVFKSTVSFLVGMGWVEASALGCVEGAELSREIWDCLTLEGVSNYLEFPADAYWSADWDEEKRQANREAFYTRANQIGDIDLMLAFGTWAGLDLAVDVHSVPTVVCSTSNAVHSGIIDSPEDSGRDHVHARVDPDRYGRQVRLFHEIVGFSRLGVVFEDTVEGRSYAGIDQITPIADELGFELVECHVPFSGVDVETASEGVARCHWELAPQIDAMYITIHRGVNQDSIASLLEPLFEYNIPSFAMGTHYEVKSGVLMSMAQLNFDYAGSFYAQTMGKILNGASPRAISQILRDPQEVSVNVETAKRIGFRIPLDILSEAAIVVELYGEVEEQ